MILDRLHAPTDARRLTRVELLALSGAMRARLVDVFWRAEGHVVATLAARLWPVRVREAPAA